MKQVELFSEFMTLCYEPGIKFSNIKDILLKAPYVIARLDGITCKIIYLHNGTNISIPWKWLDTFSSYNTKYGYRALEIGVKDETSNEIDYLIFNFLRLIISLDNKKGDLFLETLYKICCLGTSKFREMCSQEFGEKFSPISFENLDRHLII